MNTIDQIKIGFSPTVASYNQLNINDAIILQFLAWCQQHKKLIDGYFHIPLKGILSGLYQTLNYKTIEYSLAKLHRLKLIDKKIVPNRYGNHKLILKFNDNRMFIECQKDLVYFNPAIAYRVGILEACIVYNLSYWYKSNNTKFGIDPTKKSAEGWKDYEGWIYQRSSTLANIFYTHIRNIQNALKHLVELKVLIKSEKNEDNQIYYKFCEVQPELETTYKAKHTN